MEEVLGNNAPVQAGDSVAALAARVAAEEAQRAQQVREGKDPDAIATAQTQVQEVATPPQENAPAAPNKADKLQQFRDESGELDAAKIQKSNEHLQKGIADKEALLKLNKELQKKFTQVSQEVKKEQAKAKLEIPLDDNEDLDPETERRIAEDLEKKPVKTLVKLARQLARMEAQESVKPIREEWQMSKAEQMERRQVQELDDLIRQGHGWILSEGTQRFDQVFEQNPWLKQAPEPYKAAIRFMDDIPSGKAQAAASAQGGPKTPILGANHAVPPPSSPTTVSADEEMSKLSAEYNLALSRNLIPEAEAILAKMQRLERGY